jgi:serine/threonine protein kinase
MIELGQTVGNYRITAKLGEGAVGAVFLAEHPVIGRKAALKVIHPQHARNADVVTRFVNEASAISRIRHEHIVEVTDFGRTPDDEFYFIMEYLEGRPLSDLITREAPFQPSRALTIAAQIADALTASHAHGVVHRDLKPENIFLVKRGDDPAFVKVLDFGLAKLVHGDGAVPSDTGSGVVMGTPYYMSPEQCQGRGELDHRADVYALGVVLFEMLTGKLPFGGNDYAEVLLKQISMRPPAARSLVPELPEVLDVILHRALAKDPAQRFPTMAAFRQALLEPSTHGAASPQVSVHDDLSGRILAARPMSRAEITLRRGPEPKVPTTFGEGVGQVEDDPQLDRIPRTYRPSRGFAVAGTAALAGMALAAGLAYGTAVRFTRRAPATQPARAVSLSFSSDPAGAVVIAPDGTTLGRTPLSIQVPRQDVPVSYELQKAGFEPKSVSLIPNVSSSLFPVLTRERHAEAQASSPPYIDDGPPPARRDVSTSRHRRGTRPASLLRNDEDEDGVLAPSFLK